MKEKLSAFIITKNEEDKIARCLEHLQWVDEIIVVDSYSKDKTVEIAKKFTKKIYKKNFEGYGPQKQAAINRCTNQWILEVDADEIIPEALKNEIQVLLENKEHLNRYDAYQIKRQEYFLKKPLMVSNIIRLYKKEAVVYEGIIHEKIKVKGKIKTLHNKIDHEADKYDSIAKRIDKINEYTKIEAEQLYKKKKWNVARALLYLITTPIVYFFWMYFRKGLIFNGYRGLIWSILTYYYHFLIYAKVYEYIYKEKHAPETREQ